MVSALVINALMCTVGFVIGAYTFVKHLKAFNKNAKTPPADAWIVAVGTLGWSVLLYASIDDPMITDIEMTSRMLIFVYWIGTLLKIQKHCLKLRQRIRKKNIKQAPRLFTAVLVF